MRSLNDLGAREIYPLQSMKSCPFTSTGIWCLLQLCFCMSMKTLLPSQFGDERVVLSLLVLGGVYLYQGWLVNKSKN